MLRLGELDFPDRMAAYMPTMASQFVFAIGALALAASLRMLVEPVAAGAAPFTLTFPAILIATLFARWQSGLMTLALVVAGAWYFVLPPRMSFAIEEPILIPHILVSVFSGLLVVGVAEAFRRAARHVVAERDRQLGERDLFMQEFEHRVKNNFASVAGLLDLQRRKAAEPAARDALAEALGRVESIARAHNALYRDSGDMRLVDIRAYGEELCEALSQALFLRGSIRLERHFDPVSLPRDRVIPIGLIINELVTNSAKHAFPNRLEGCIRVAFRAADGGYRLEVFDDGVGIASAAGDGIGMRLVNAFARDAGGRVEVISDGPGTTIAVQIDR